MTVPRGQVRLLTHHFFDRFLDNDLLSPREGLQAGFAEALAVFLMPGLLVPVALLLKYSRPSRTAAQRE